jgi:hypothetical protein
MYKSWCMMLCEWSSNSRVDVHSAERRIRYYASARNIHLLGADRALICSHELDAAALDVNAAVTQLLGLCRGARTIDEHAAHIHRITGGSLEQIREALGALRQTGLLRAINVRPVERARSTRKTTIMAVGIPSADRPHLLRRAIEDARVHTATEGRRVRCFVLDGSHRTESQHESEGARGPTRDQRNERLNVIHIRRHEATAIAHWLAKQLGDASPLWLAAALATGSAGSQRNLLLLLTAGQNALMVDDDIRWTIWQSALHRPGVVLGGHTDLRERRYFASRAAAVAAIEECRASLFAIHEEWLGSRLADIVDEQTDLSDACGHVLTLIKAVPTPCVRVTMTGLAGDSGFYCPYLQLLEEGPAKLALASSRDVFELALSSREVHRIATQVVITHDTACMAGCLAVSNMDLVPPFMWLGRNEDGVFGASLGAAYPNTLFGHVPWGIVHDSDRESAWPAGPAASALRSRLADVMLGIIRRASTARPASFPDSGMTRLARAFRDIGSLRLDEFRLFVRDIVLEARARQLAKLQTIIDNDPYCPEYWRRTVAAYISDSVASLATPDFFCPHEFRRPSQLLDDGFRECQRFISEFAHVLELWPNLWEHCRKLGPDELIHQARSAQRD